MTIKTVLQISEQSIKTISSDMTKRRAVRKNLFGTTVDREELRRQLEQLEGESNVSLQSYKCESVLGLIERSSEDIEASKSGKLKRLQFSEPSDSDEGSDSSESVADEASSASTSSTHSIAPTSTKASSSDKPSNVHLVQNPPLSKGQKTIKGKFPGNVHKILGLKCLRSSAQKGSHHLCIQAISQCKPVNFGCENRFCKT
jgi:hypothetical protein